MLRGERVTLRAFDVADAAVMAEWYADHEFAVLDGSIYPQSMATIEAWIRALPAPSIADVSLGIEDEHQTLIGLIRLKRVQVEDSSAELGIAIARPWWSKRYGRDAIRTLLRFAFEEMNLHRVWLGVLDNNERARRCYEASGFTMEGTEREARYRFGEWRDHLVMGMLREEFAAALTNG